jgi:hypothetical protein
MGFHRAYLHNPPAEYFQHHRTLVQSSSLFAGGAVADISGWVVEAVVPAVGTKLVRRRYLFAVSSDNAGEAERLVRQRLGSLHCAVAVRLRLEPRAVANLKMGSDAIKELAR